MQQFLERFNLDMWEGWAILGIRVVVYGSLIYTIGYKLGWF